MARINIEDSLWGDPRFMRLAILLGCEFKAAGVVIFAWKIAQKYWCPNKLPIPKEDFIRAHLPVELIEAGLAVESKDGVRICGCEAHFAWWFERHEAGKKSARARKEKYGTAQPNPNEHRTKPNGTSDEHRTSSSSSSSSSSSLSTSTSFKKDAQNKNQSSPSALEILPKASDFELLYSIYPRKIGRKKGLTTLMRKYKIFKRRDLFFELVREAIEKYKKYLESQQTEAKYIQHFSTFVNQWEDWLHPEAGDVKDIVRPAQKDWLEIYQERYEGKSDGNNAIQNSDGTSKNPMAE